MTLPCNNCVILAMCGNRTISYKVITCIMIRAYIIRESNLLDPNGLSKIVSLGDTDLFISINYYTDSNKTPIEKAKQILLIHTEYGYHHELILGDYKQLYDEVKLFYDQSYVGE